MPPESTSLSLTRATLAALPAVLLALLLQWLVATVYAGLIVETFGGARATTIVSGPDHAGRSCGPSPRWRSP